MYHIFSRFNAAPTSTFQIDSLNSWLLSGFLVDFQVGHALQVYLGFVIHRWQKTEAPSDIIVLVQDSSFLGEILFEILLLLAFGQLDLNISLTICWLVISPTYRLVITEYRSESCSIYVYRTFARALTLG